MKGFLDYLPGGSVLHKMHPLVKIFVSILICAAAFCSSNYFFLLGIWRLADKLIPEIELMGGVYAWIIRIVSLCVLAATVIIYYMKYMRKKN